MSYRGQFATIYLAVVGPAPVSRDDVIAFLAPLLAGDYSAGYPTLAALRLGVSGPDEYGTATVQGGAYDGVQLAIESPSDARYLTAVAWNVRRRDQRDVVSAMLGPVRERFRAARRSGESRLGPGVQVLSWSMQPYGEILSGYRGVPPIPSLPPEPRRTPPVVANDGGTKLKDLWWILPAVAVAYSIGGS